MQVPSEFKDSVTPVFTCVTNSVTFARGASVYSVEKKLGFSFKTHDVIYTGNKDLRPDTDG
jgi:hypothetical protein